MTQNRRTNNAICPYCDSKMRVSDVKRITPMLTKRTYNCRNDNGQCGAIIEYADSPMRLISPPAQHREGVDIPMSPRAEKRLVTQ
jgi:hypothetical protein